MLFSWSLQYINVSSIPFFEHRAIAGGWAAPGGARKKKRLSNPKKIFWILKFAKKKLKIKTDNWRPALSCRLCLYLRKVIYTYAPGSGRSEAQRLNKKLRVNDNLKAVRISRWGLARYRGVFIFSWLRNSNFNFYP